MRKAINLLKKITPVALWLGVRKPYYVILEFLRSIGPQILKRQYCGLTLYYNRGSSIMRRVKKEGIFEKKMGDEIIKHLLKSAEPVLFDVGANLGLISSRIISEVPNVNIFAFEPGPSQGYCLEKTIATNGLAKQVHLFKEAMSDKEGEMDFSSHDPKYSAGDGFVDTGRARLSKIIKVKVGTLDNKWALVQKPKVNVIKIDTEGAELWVLKGAVNLLQACKPVIFLEIEPRNLKVYPYSYNDIFDFLMKQNYSLFTLDGDRVNLSNFKSFIEQGQDTYVAKPGS
jgi:FkbM family methyltransferase